MEKIILWLLLGIVLTVPLILWIISFFKRSFTPVQGEIYMLTFFGIHLFEIHLGNPNVKWHQRLGIYILFWPFHIASFMYEWVQEMTYAEFLEKKEKAKNIKDYSVSVAWEPAYNKAGKNADGSTRESDLAPDGTPIDKTTRILVSRRERMTSLREVEGFALAVEFETSDGFRGWRIFTLMFKIKDLSKIISKFRQWQKAASLKFQGEYNTWSKKVTYQELRSTRLDDLLIKIGSTDGPFTDEINETIEDFGFEVSKIMEGAIYLSLETQDMLESQEQKKKAQDKQDAAEIQAKTTETEATARANAKKILAEAEAGNIKTIGTATNKVLAERIKKLKNLYTYQKDLIAAKYGATGLQNLKFYIENGGQGNSDVQKIVDTLLGVTLHGEIEKEGGTNG